MTIAVTIGHIFLLAFYIQCLTPAFKIGFSFRPPPPIIPIIALLLASTVFLIPLGNLILVLPPSSLWPITVAKAPEERAYYP